MLCSAERSRNRKHAERGDRERERETYFVGVEEFIEEKECERGADFKEVPTDHENCICYCAANGRSSGFVVEKKEW